MRMHYKNVIKIIFRFGDSEPELGNKQVFIETFVVPSSIPLLLSRKAIKTAKMTIDYSSDTVKVQNIEHLSFLTSCGQYSIPIRARPKNNQFLPQILQK